MFQNLHNWIDQFEKAGFLARVPKAVDASTQTWAFFQSKLRAGGFVLRGAVS